MKLHSQTYTSPVLTEGTFNNVFIEETSLQLKRQENYLKIDFEMYYFKNNEKVIIAESYLAFQGMNEGGYSTNKKATFKFLDDTEEEPRGLIDYVAENEGAYPENYTMINWGYPSFEDALNYLSGGSFENPEIQPVNDFVKAWILNTVIMKGEFIGVQFQFV
jgi:hypothetical protein